MSDPIVFELFKNAIFSIADEMALTVFRTTYSGVLKDNMDYSTGFADAEGNLVAQGLTLPYTRNFCGKSRSAPRWAAWRASATLKFRTARSPGNTFMPCPASCR